MAIQETQTSYIFPRIPLVFSIPESYPVLGRITNISVVPEIAEYYFNREEIEIKGNYHITVSYFKSVPEYEFVSGPRELKCEFFDSMTVSANGLLTDSEEDFPETRSDTRELYSVQFSRPVHTFVDLEFIGRPRSFKPALTVEKVDMEIAGERKLKGDLVLGLANRARRSSWQLGR